MFHHNRKSNLNLSFQAVKDDKLGSHWNFLPMPEDGVRESKHSSSRWRYRQCLQGNTYYGVRHFLSLVPPMLPTGNNFG